jgi:hypothetical protein
MASVKVTKKVEQLCITMFLIKEDTTGWYSLKTYSSGIIQVWVGVLLSRLLWCSKKSPPSLQTTVTWKGILRVEIIIHGQLCFGKWTQYVSKMPVHIWKPFISWILYTMSWVVLLSKLTSSVKEVGSRPTRHSMLWKKTYLSTTASHVYFILN